MNTPWPKQLKKLPMSPTLHFKEVSATNSFYNYLNIKPIQKRGVAGSAAGWSVGNTVSSNGNSRYKNSRFSTKWCLFMDKAITNQILRVSCWTNYNKDSSLALRMTVCIKIIVCVKMTVCAQNDSLRKNYSLHKNFSLHKNYSLCENDGLCEKDSLRKHVYQYKKCPDYMS